MREALRRLDRPLSAAALALAALLLAGAAADALAEPEVTLRVSRAPHYVGDTIEIHLEATGFEADPEPTCTVDPPTQGTLRLVAVVPTRSSSVQILNGRVTTSESTTYTCQYRFTPSATGSVALGPFRVAQTGVERKTARHALRIEEIAEDPNLQLHLVLPDKPVYLGQQTPVRIEWWLERDLRNRIADYTLRSELFERDDTFRFLNDAEPPVGSQTLEIESAAGPLTLPADVAERREGGRRFLVISAERTLVPLREGRFALEPATIHVEEVTRWQRDLFGGRRPVATRKIFTRDRPRELVVEAPPLADRPESFAGAVGSGFSLEVAADRSVVQVGDPIALTLTLRGSGNLASAGLPRLDADGGLSAERFRLPESEPPGELRGDAKEFRVSLRVLDVGVREIPALAYSWFDPELGAYQTARSLPIALSVRPAQMISAADVVGPAPTESVTEAPDADPATAPLTDETRGSVRRIGADLSIERNPAALLRRGTAGWQLQVAGYAGSLLLLLGAIALRRRADVDPELQRRRSVHAAQGQRLRAAASLPRREGLAERAAALREILTAAPELRDAEVEALLRDCDAVIYAPAGGDEEPIPGDLVQRAEAWLEAAGARLR